MRVKKAVRNGLTFFLTKLDPLASKIKKYIRAKKKDDSWSWTSTALPSLAISSQKTVPSLSGRPPEYRFFFYFGRRFSGFPGFPVYLVEAYVVWKQLAKEPLRFLFLEIPGNPNCACFPWSWFLVEPRLRLTRRRISHVPRQANAGSPKARGSRVTWNPISRRRT